MYSKNHSANPKMFFDPYRANSFSSNSRCEEKCCCRMYCEENQEPDNSAFFFPNICKICGCMPCAENRLFRCSKCQMISYCGKVHQIQDWPFHNKFCKALAETRRKHDVLQASKGRNQEAWMNAKLELFNLVSRKLNRKLTPYEQKVIKFPRACLVCHDVDQANLVNCPNCPSASFCQQHKDLREKVHANMCPEFKLCYTIELEKFRKKNKPEEKNGNSKAKKNFESKIKSDSREDFLLSSEEEYLDPDTVISVIKEVPMKSLPYFEKFPDSMRSFLKILSSINSNVNLSMEKSFEIADLFTKPLSTLRVLEKLDRVQEKDLIIHVIGAKPDDLETYLFWETFLHLMPNLISLKVVLFNPEFVGQILSPKLCEKCVKKQKKLVFQLYNLGYKKFLEEKSFSEPSLVIGFKIRVQTEAESLKCVSYSVTPFAFTSDTEKQTKEVHKDMKKLLGKLVDYDIFEKNSFSGSNPSLNFETDGVSYEHQFLTIYTDLGKQAKENKTENAKRNQNEIK